MWWIKNHLQYFARKTYRFDQIVCAAFVYDALVGRRRHPDAGEGSGLTRVPARSFPCRETGRPVAPERLTGAAFFIHQDHGRVDELSATPGGGNYSRKGGGSGCRRVGPGGGRHGGHAAGPGVQALLVLTESSSRWRPAGGRWDNMRSVFCDSPAGGIWMEMCSHGSFQGWEGRQRWSEALDTGS